MIEKVRIGPIDYALEDKRGLDITDGAIGRISHSMNVIEFDSALEAQGRMHTILHEIFHGIIRQSQLEGKFGSDEATEDAINSMAYGILQVIRDNPDLIAEIQALWQK